MNNLFELTEKADYCLKNNIDVPSDIQDNLSKLIKNNGFVGIAQINTIPGNIEYNAKKIAKYLKFSEKTGLEAVIFPELALTGYPLQDTLSRHEIVADDSFKWLRGIAKCTHDTIAFVGFVEQSGFDFYNSVALVHKGKIQSVARKCKIPHYSNFNDNKYFKSSAEFGFSYSIDSYDTESYNGYALTIGEDCSSDSFNSLVYAGRSKLLINCAISLNGQFSIKSKKFSDLSKKYQLPLINVNLVGMNDSFSFEGISSAYSINGELIYRAKAFEEQFAIVNPYKSIGKIYDIPKSCDQNIKIKEFSLNYEADLERTYKTLIQGIKDYFSKCGIQRAVLGLSGGLDSTVCAVLLSDALGQENVLGISMPSHITSNESKSDAEILAKNLGIHFAEAPIKEMFDTTNKCLGNLFNNIQQKWDARYKNSFTPDNIQARSRAMILWGISNEFSSCIPIATSDKSEAYMGYATINGDMSGGFAPIADITKTKLFALARWLNNNRVQKNVIPESILIKRPGAELAINPKTNKPLIAEDALMPYEFLDEIIWRIENNKESYTQLLHSEFLYEKNNHVSNEQKLEWLNKFYKRMSSALYKWSIMPPSVIVDSNSIFKSVYNQPIITSGINYKGVDENYINGSLK